MYFLFWEFKICRTDCRTALKHEVIITPRWCQWSGARGDKREHWHCFSSPVHQSLASLSLSLSNGLLECNPCPGCASLLIAIYILTSLTRQQSNINIIGTIFPMLVTSLCPQSQGLWWWNIPKVFLVIIVLTLQLSDLANDYWRWVCLMSQRLFLSWENLCLSCPA